MELKCSIQTYAWGKYGIDSTVASLYKSANPDFIVNENTTYAELWMGTHPNGPAYLKGEDKLLLNTYIQENQHVLGENVLKHFGAQLPFLFKVLSVNKALSIQVHPNKAKAKELHRQQPNIYKDPNHKPELAIALTPFEALCGFRPISEIKNYFKLIPELAAVVGENNITDLNNADEASLKSALKKCVHSLMTCNPKIVSGQLYQLLDKFQVMDQQTRQTLNANLFERLHLDYPGDVGCFCIYLFNYLTLQPGEAIYLGANEPHAYLSGDCVECMAWSDNVIRAGLTPKLKDVPTLLDVLSYDCLPLCTKRFYPVREDECTEIFRPPVEDFAIARITILPGRASYSLIPRDTASILIIINGKAEIQSNKILNRGSVLFIAANEQINIKVLCGCHPMLMYQALANV